MRSTLLAFLAPALLLAAGCSSNPGGSDDSPPTKTESTPRLHSVSDKSLPLDAYAISDDQYYQVNLASVKLQRQCMAAYDIDFDFTPPRPATETQMARRYLSYDLNQAQSNGYQYRPASSPGSKPPLPNLTPEQLAVLVGASKPGDARGESPIVGEYNGEKIPVGGCVRQARRQLRYVDKADPDGIDVVENLDDEAYASMLKDQRVLTVFAKWSACMKGHGFNYLTPGDANDDPKWQASEVVSADEKATAVADVTCKLKHNVLGIQFAVEAEYDRILIEQHAEALDEIQNLNDERLKAAAKILSGAS